MESILANEKYKGDALLQKRFMVDFPTKTLKYAFRDGETVEISADVWKEA